MRFATSKPRQPARSVALDERLKRLTDKRRSFFKASERARFDHELVVKCERDAHVGSDLSRK
jgi:hypothetical protein